MSVIRLTLQPQGNEFEYSVARGAYTSKYQALYNKRPVAQFKVVITATMDDRYLGFSVRLTGQMLGYVSDKLTLTSPSTENGSIEAAEKKQARMVREAKKWVRDYLSAHENRSQ